MCIYLGAKIFHEIALIFYLVYNSPVKREFYYVFTLLNLAIQRKSQT